MSFNLPEQMFQMALLLLEERKLCKIILKSMHNVEAMLWTSLMYGHFIIWLSSVTLTFNLPEQMFQMALLLKKNKYVELFVIHA